MDMSSVLSTQGLAHSGSQQIATGRRNECHKTEEVNLILLFQLG